MSTFFAMQSEPSGNITITRSDDYPFKDYMKEGLRRLPTVDRVVDYGTHLVLELEADSALKAEAVGAYTNQMADRYQRELDEQDAELKKAVNNLARAITRPATRRPALRRRPPSASHRAHWSDANAGAFDILNPLRWL